MDKNKIKDFKNILKMYIAIAVPVIILLTSFYNYVYENEVEKTAELIMVEEKKKASIIKYVIEDIYENMIDDLFVVENSNEMKAYSSKPDEYTEKELEKMFSRFLSNKTEIDQIRFLDATGREIVRAENDNGEVVLIPKGELQDKSDRYYFKYACGLNDGQVYISPMDLNVENGKVQVPYEPMIRFATPLYSKNGECKGVLVINYKGQDFLNVFKEHFAKDEEGIVEAMLSDSKGYYLFNKQEDKNFGFMFKGRERVSLAHENKELWQEIIKNENGVFESGSEIYYYSHIHPESNISRGHNDNNWVIVSSFDFANIPLINGESVFNIKRTWIISLILMGLFILVIVIVTYYFKKDKNQLKLTKDIADSTNDAVIITDSNTNILYANKAFEKYTGYRREEVMGLKPSNFKSDKQSRDFYKKMWKEINEKGLWQGNLWDRKKNGVIYPKHLTIIAVKNKSKGRTVNYIGIFKDLTNEKETERYVSKLKNYNLSTNLPNENLLVELVENSIKSDKDLFAIIYFSIENYNKMIVKFGSGHYKQLIREMTNSIESIMEKEDFVAQTSASEFVIVLKSKESLHMIKDFMDEFVERTKRSVRLNEKEICLDIKSGIAVYPNDGENANELISNANIALEILLGEKGENYKFYKQEFKEHLSKESELELLLSKAIFNNELDIHYQPQIETCEEKIVGAEALLRWKNEKLGYVSPAKFIPIAEKTGLIVEIGNWIIDRVCGDVKLFEDLQCDDFKIAINISAVQFKDSDVLNQLRKSIEKHGVNPKNIEIEITESLLIEDLDSINEKLKMFKSLGTSVAIDDFGTGFSSLSYLKKLNIDKLKIDRIFIKDYPEDDNGEMAEIITEMGKKLNLKVITEGAETKEQVEYLKSIGCNLIQGYYYSKPLPKESFEEFYRSQNQRKVSE
ncbi:PAS domain S-box-containing protein [Peptoclostridium litorale DSM 5388]|uniref:Diguanylate cyclase/phosphodiesterase n=1 Tax=Peptoclostridium litorale DSM 5388 TaxID=1121324 RepID=A0A069RFT9_PEPLI|nr:EAL domain-containing protein [Peptoclostridium litorale]KDR95638.1 diguanylate cyclase/phosphodiesterase [Peptoclostridium litorale DSM 5388]SIN99977.1 PAS domain S-box-containing protein [Peptoclostridium litorale DSM 5388]